MVLFIILMGGISLAQEQAGYLNRYVFHSGTITAKPVADASGVYVAVDGDGIYRFSPRGEKELYFQHRAKFSGLTLSDMHGSSAPGRILAVETMGDGGGSRILYLSASDFRQVEKNDSLPPIQVERKSIPAFRVPSDYTSDDSSYLTSMSVDGKNIIVVKAVNVKNGVSEILFLDTNGNKMFNIALSGRYSAATVAVSGGSLFVAREIRDGIRIIDRINPEKGLIENEIMLGEACSVMLAAEGHNGYIYLLNNKGGENSLLPSITTFSENLSGDEGFILIPLDKINYAYSQLLFASNLNPYFKKYMALKYGKNPEPYDRAMIDDASMEYAKAWSVDPFNPFYGMYYVLAEIELGRTTQDLKKEIDRLEQQCGYDVYKLSLMGGLFCRYRLDAVGSAFLQKAIDYAPASEVDYARSFTTGNNSPAAYLMGILGRMSEDRDPSMERIVSLVSYMSEMMPSSEFNYYLWSGISGYFAKKGNKQQAQAAGEKAKYYYRTNHYLSPGRTAGFDMLSNLAVILGILFVVLSFWFGFRANRKKRHYLSEVSGVSEMGGILELLNNALKPAEKTLLGILFSLGLISVFADIMLMFMMQKSGGYYGLILAVSIAVGVFAAVYIFIVLLRVERKHYGFATVTGDKSFRNTLNNSFLPFMSYREKMVLIFISLMGPLFAFALLGMLDNSVFTDRVPVSIAGGAYGSDSSRAFLENRLRTDPGNPYLQLVLGYDCLLRKDYDGAEKHYLSFLSFNPADPGAAANLAVARSYSNPEEGRQMLEKMVQNRKLIKSWRYADRLYYDLVLLDKNISGKDTISPWQAELDKTVSKTVAANQLIHSGRLLSFPPKWEQERGAYAASTDVSGMVYSYLFPFVMLNNLHNIHGTGYNAGSIAVGLACLLYWIWTLLLILSFFMVKDPPFIPTVCKRCGKIICEKCTRQDDRGWCLRCAENNGFVSPSPFCLFLPGVRQILIGETVRGTVFMTLFLYGVSYCLLMIIPYRNVFPGGAQGRYLGVLQSIMAPNTIFPYNVITDPVLWGFALFVIALTAGVFALNALEVLKGGRFRDKSVRTDVETQLLEYKAMRTRLIGQSRLL